MKGLSLSFVGAEVREVDLQALTGGILHTKLWVVDTQHLYLGSANMDWRSLSQVHGARRSEHALHTRCTHPYCSTHTVNTHPNVERTKFL